MPGILHPREALKALLKGERPARPLFLPIVFSLGARIENLAMPAFLSNPTKIASALRQMHAHLHTDGVTCYFDPYLEAEALGGKLHWETPHGPPQLRWPGISADGELPAEIRPAEEAARSGRVLVAAEVVRRVKSALRDSTLLMVGLTGPLALAEMLAGACNRAEGCLPATAVETAGAATTEIARVLLEAGANVVVIRENFSAEVPKENGEERGSQLATVVNVVRFYEALPMLLLGGKTRSKGNKAANPLASGHAVPCIEIPRRFYNTAGMGIEVSSATWGLALPASAFAEEESFYAQFEQGMYRAIGLGSPAVVTTSDDVPLAADINRLARLATALPRVVWPADLQRERKRE